MRFTQLARSSMIPSSKGRLQPPAGSSQFMNLPQVSVSQKGVAISAYGIKRTYWNSSAFGGKADIGRRLLRNHDLWVHAL